jgi:hypothetical protein
MRGSGISTLFGSAAMPTLGPECAPKRTVPGRTNLWIRALVDRRRPFRALPALGARAHHKSSRIPLNTGCRTFPSADFALYSISASNDGSTQMPRCAMCLP